MKHDIDSIKREMLAELERDGTIDIRSWVRRIADMPSELLDYAMWLEASPPIDEAPAASEAAVDAAGIAEGALQAGLGLLSKAVEAHERRLSKLLANERQIVANQRGRGKAREPFRRAAIQTWVFDQVRGAQTRVSRYITFKSVYLVERALDLRLFTSYKKMPAGPYDSRLRYVDAEPIALRRGWIVSRDVDLEVGKNVKEVYKYAPAYLGGGRATKELLSFLRGVPPWELETWTTVDTIVHELCATRQPISVDGVTKCIAESIEWKDKLRKQNFSTERIGSAIDHLGRLGLIPS